MYPQVTLQLPDWVAAAVGDPARRFPTLEERMAFVIDLAAQNVATRTGGPFGAAIFEIKSGRLVAPGVNVVVSQRCSLAHAEAVAIMVAQQVCQTYDLGAAGLPPLELVASAQPCIQCYGNLWWSGVRRLVIGARREDVESLTGFHEGPLPHDWVAQLEDRPPLPPIAVIRDVLREEARAVLQRYRDQGGPIYNPIAS
ncbi:MAG TPA: nucleoside deaminase [Chloroflexi bacterium]|nr:nucleoside deaminase [Chloroflexota bacterium]